MTSIPSILWLIPLLPLVAAGLSALASREQKRFAATLAIGSMGLSFVLSVVAFGAVLSHAPEGRFAPQNFAWIQWGEATLKLGFILDPLSAIMLVMVTFVGLLIFIYSVGYMAHDENFTRFFCFLSLFAAAMLGVVIANNLLLLFICWELVGLASYLLIGFWYHKPSAAAAAKKAFITTRIGDIGFFLGLLWLYSETGTLLFYDNGAGCLEQSALTALVAKTTFAGMAVSTAIALLIFCGAVGKSGQVPLHVWLPDAMEGPTPVSALIHAATMVAAGVFLVARVYPLMAAGGADPAHVTTALQVVTWVGAITAVFAALIATAQNDIKRILAYSTVSQLGNMMMGLGVGGIAVGMFHLITHAFFKALLFLGAGSVIHGCHEEQDIRRMGGLKKFMPITFATYAIGMLALAGFPIFFSGFWSKDEILHAAWIWPVSKIPFLLGIFGALLTAFYMTRQVCYVFFGVSRLPVAKASAEPGHGHAHGTVASSLESPVAVHESPPVMTYPLVILAVFAMALGIVGTPAWPWFHGFLTGHEAHFDISKFMSALPLLLLSAVIVFSGLGLGYFLYGRKPIPSPEAPDVLEQKQPALFRVLQNKFYVDEIYDATVVRFQHGSAWLSDILDRLIWNGAVHLIAGLVLIVSWISRLLDEFVVNWGFDRGCGFLRGGGQGLSQLQTGQVHHYLRIIGISLTLLILLLTWGFTRS